MHAMVMAVPPRPPPAGIVPSPSAAEASSTAGQDAIAAKNADQAWALGQATADASGWSVSKAKILTLVPTRLDSPSLEMLRIPVAKTRIHACHPPESSEFVQVWLIHVPTYAWCLGTGDSSSQC